MTANPHNLPWQAANIFAYDAAENIVVTAYGRNGDDARNKIKMIVRAVNSHAALVAALDGILEIADKHHDYGEIGDPRIGYAFQFARAVLKAAREPSP